MASGEFGGDGSVAFRLHVEGLNSQSSSTTGKEHEHEVVDDTDAGGTFTIEIKMPASAPDLTFFQTSVRAFNDAVNPPPTSPAPRQNSRVSFELPIEAKNHASKNFPQISVKWDSKV